MSKSSEVIIIGGSFAGLSAAMALGRALRHVLIIDSGKPCNQPTPHAHNLITHDRQAPAMIRQQALAQVLRYPTVSLLNASAVNAVKAEDGFAINIETGETFNAQKLLFTTGIKDIMPAIEGFSDCWGKSVLHCPYCHGYEVKNEPTAIISNGAVSMHLAQMIHHWTKKLTLFTNGPALLQPQEIESLRIHHIQLVEDEIMLLEHTDGQVEQIVLKNGGKHAVKAIYAKPAFEQHCLLPASLGCLTDGQGYIQVNEFKETNIAGIFAAGDNTTPFRSLSVAIAAGTMAGTAINKQLIEEEW